MNEKTYSPIPVGSPLFNVKINVPIPRYVLEDITWREVTKTDVDIEESVEDILQIYLSEREERVNKYGDAAKGYQWDNVCLPNGSQLYVVYNNKVHHAAVKSEKIVYEGESYSPSGLVRKIANGAARNAWRNIFIQEPGVDVWRRADDIRLKNAN